jgi:hypothetical protein
MLRPSCECAGSMYSWRTMQRRPLRRFRSLIRTSAFACSLLSLAAGCETTRPVQAFNGFTLQPPETVAEVRESDGVYIDAIDDRLAVNDNGFYLNDVIPYRRYQLLPGTRRLMVRFDKNDLYSSPRPLTVNVKAGRKYAFKSNVSTFYINLGGPANTATWQPELYDEETNEVVGKAAEPFK